MRSVGLAVVAALTLATSVGAQSWQPSASWLAQAQCVHAHEGPWGANTGNGYFGGMQFAPQTWTGVHGEAQAAFLHPGDPAFPFTASPREQLHRAWLVWLRDGKNWRSWGSVGAACAQTFALRPG